jgi:MYXO-CTERM domain-containing protein
MSIFNRRNALFGWLAWLTAKRMMKRKARSAVPGTEAAGGKAGAGVAAAVAAAVGGLIFWRRRRAADEADPADAGPDDSGE